MNQLLFLTSILVTLPIMPNYANIEEADDSLNQHQQSPSASTILLTFVDRIDDNDGDETGQEEEEEEQGSDEEIFGINVNSNNGDNDDDDDKDDYSVLFGKLLQQLEENEYDRKWRPNYGGQPVRVWCSIHVGSLSAFSEQQMDFTIDFYFRQFWDDYRIAWNASSKQKISIGIDYNNC